MQYTEFTSITARLAGSYEQRQMVFQDLYGSLNPPMTGGQMPREPGMTDRRSYADRDPDQQRMPGRPVEDSVVLVTGAASGIGRAAAVELGAQGACVFACDRDGRGVEAVVASIESAGGRAAGCWLDVASKSEVDAAVRAALLQFGRVDGLVANAGVPSSQSFLAVTEQELDEVFAVNVKGVMFCGQAVATVMVDQRAGGKIVNVSSVAAVVAAPGLSAYSASKAAIGMLTRAMAYELGPAGVRVNAVAPGVIRTGMNPLTNPARNRQLETAIPVRHIGTPEDVAHVIAFLLSPAADYINGETIVVDGGWTLNNDPPREVRSP